MNNYQKDKEILVPILLKMDLIESKNKSEKNRFFLSKEHKRNGTQFIWVCDTCQQIHSVANCWGKSYKLLSKDQKSKIKEYIPELLSITYT